MWECKNASEPMDLKLMTILFMRRLWILAVAFIAGALFAGGISVLKEVVFAPEPRYLAETEIYVDYAANEEGIYTYYALNAEGWEAIIKTDKVLEAAAEKLSFEINLSDLRDTIKTNPRTDHRFVQIQITYKDSKKTVEISNAIEESLVSFAKEMRECENIRIFTSAKEADRIVADAHTFEIMMLGGVLFTLALFFIVWFAFILDDSIYVPIMFEKRYKIQMLGIYGTNNEKYNQELINAEKRLKHENLNEIFLYFLEELPLEKIKNTAEDLDLQVFEADREYGKDSKAVLFIPAGKKNGKMIEKIIFDLRKRGVEPIAAILSQVDMKLIGQYYFGIGRK